MAAPPPDARHAHSDPHGLADRLARLHGPRAWLLLAAAPALAPRRRPRSSCSRSCWWRPTCSRRGWAPRRRSTTAAGEAAVHAGHRVPAARAAQPLRRARAAARTVAAGARHRDALAPLRRAQLGPPGGAALRHALAPRRPRRRPGRRADHQRAADRGGAAGAAPAERDRLAQDPDDPRRHAARRCRSPTTARPARLRARRGALPRAGVVGSQQVVPGEDAQLDAVLDPASTAAARSSRRDAAARAARRPGGAARRAAPGSSTTSPSGSSSTPPPAGPRELVLTDVHYPGWKVKLDGKPADLHRVDYLLRGTSCPPAATASSSATSRPRSGSAGSSACSRWSSCSPRSSSAYGAGAPSDSVSCAPVLSVLMPVYNEVATVKQAIDEVLAADIGMDLELIVVDDGSTDGTRELLARGDWPARRAGPQARAQPRQGRRRAHRARGRPRRVRGDLRRRPRVRPGRPRQPAAAARQAATPTPSSACAPSTATRATRSCSCSATRASRWSRTSSSTSTCAT